MTASIELTSVAKYYGELPHQKEALTWLQGQIPASALDEFAKLWRSQPPQLISLANLEAITTVAPRARLQEYLPALNAGCLRFKINTSLRLAHFLAQLCHESAEFRYTEEIASGADYEGRGDLGNTEPGDGVRFKGRGLIQVTGRENYADCSRDLGVDFIANPPLLAQLPHSVNSAFWYWNSRGLSRLADANDFDQITEIINGGYNGYDLRRQYFNRAIEVFQ